MDQESNSVSEIIVCVDSGLGYCVDCGDNDKETQGYTDWEMHEGISLCYDCLNLRERNRRSNGGSIPQEWMDESYDEYEPNPCYETAQNAWRGI